MLADAEKLIEADIAAYGRACGAVSWGRHPKFSSSLAAGRQFRAYQKVERPRSGMRLVGCLHQTWSMAEYVTKARECGLPAILGRHGRSFRVEGVSWDSPQFRAFRRRGFARGPDGGYVSPEEGTLFEAPFELEAAA